MTLNKKLQAFLDAAKQKDSYWVENAKMKFALALEGQRRVAGMTYGALASKIGTSAAYISKIFRGDSNVTIETMVKLARATGGNLEINIVQPGAQVAPWRIPTGQHALTAKYFTVGTGTTIDRSVQASNGETWALTA